MTLIPEQLEALEAELDHYVRLCHEQAKQLKRYAELQQRCHQLLSKLLKEHKQDSKLEKIASSKSIEPPDDIKIPRSFRKP